MSEKSKRGLIACLIVFVLFVGFTVVLKTVDVQPVGPLDSSVGLASLNQFMLARASGSDLFRLVTDIAACVSIAIVLALAVYGIVQWIRRKDVRKVDPDLIAAGIVFFLTALSYLIFEIVVINFRPVLDNGKLAASYPSSHVLLVLTVTLVTATILENRIRNKVLKALLPFLLDAIAVATVLLREQSGIHWFTDILGGMLLSGTFVLLFQFLAGFLQEKKKEKEQEEEAKTLVPETGEPAEADGETKDSPEESDSEEPEKAEEPEKSEEAETVEESEAGEAETVEPEKDEPAAPDPEIKPEEGAENPS